MAFQNVFDAGPQTVYVDAYNAQDGHWDWSGQLGKGQSATFDDPKNAGNTFTVKVTSDGAVVFSQSASRAAGYYSVYVGVPSTTQQAQIADYVSTGAAFGYFSAASTTNTGVWQQYIDGFHANEPVTPNPYGLDQATNAYVYGVCESGTGAAGEMLRFSVLYSDEAKAFPIGNWLASPGRVLDSNRNRPPAWWDGAVYAVIDAGPGTSSGILLQSMNDFSAVDLPPFVDPALYKIQNGDHVAFDLIVRSPFVVSPAWGNDQPFLIVAVDDVELTRISLLEAATTRFVSPTLGEGAYVTIAAELVLENGNIDYGIYNGLDLEIVPVIQERPQAFWTDFVACEET